MSQGHREVRVRIVKCCMKGRASKGFTIHAVVDPDAAVADVDRSKNAIDASF